MSMILGFLYKKYFYSLSNIVLIYSLLMLALDSVAITARAAVPTTSLFPLTAAATPPSVPQPLPIAAPTQVIIAPPSVIVPPISAEILPVAPPLMPLPIAPAIVLPPLFNSQSFVTPSISPGSIVAPTPVSSTPQPITVSLSNNPAPTIQPSEIIQSLPQPTQIVVIDPDSIVDETLQTGSKMPMTTAVMYIEQEHSVSPQLLYEVVPSEKERELEAAPLCPVTPIELPHFVDPSKAMMDKAAADKTAADKAAADKATANKAAADKAAADKAAADKAMANKAAADKAEAEKAVADKKSHAKKKSKKKMPGKKKKHKK